MNSQSILREDGEIKTKLIIFMIICKPFIMIGAVEFLDMTLISDWSLFCVDYQNPETFNSGADLTVKASPIYVYNDQVVQLMYWLVDSKIKMSEFHSETQLSGRWTLGHIWPMAPWPCTPEFDTL